MKHLPLLFSLLFASLASSMSAQDIAPFQEKDVAAVSLTPEVMMQLTNKKWYLHTRKFLLKGNVDQRSFDVAGEYEFIHGGACRQPQFSGSWTINGAENLLVIIADSLEDAKKQGHVLLGGYAIYRITDKELILGKVLTSTFDNKIFFCFENQERHQQRSLSAGIQNRDFALQQLPAHHQPKATDKALSKADLFMRGLKEEPGFAFFIDENGNVFKVKSE